MLIKSRIENLRLIEKFVDDISVELNLPQEVYGNLMIATLEAVNNAIVHGNKLREELDVEILFQQEKNRLKLTVKDQGPGFDYKSIPDPTAPENLEKISGRGVFLMEKLSDDIEFENNGAIVTLCFNT